MHSICSFRLCIKVLVLFIFKNLLKYLSKMLKCKSLLDFFNFNSESEILKGPDHSEPSVSGLPVTCVSYESEYRFSSGSSIHVYLNQHLNDGCKTSSAELPNTDHADMRSSQRNRILLRMSVQDAI